MNRFTTASAAGSHIKYTEEGDKNRSRKSSQEKCITRLNSGLLAPERKCVTVDAYSRSREGKEKTKEKKRKFSSIRLSSKNRVYSC